MIKSGKNDKKVNILITGVELVELHKHVWSIAECYGLDNRIAKYKGKRPIGLYRWDFECLVEVLRFVLNSDDYYPSKDTPEYHALDTLFKKLNDEYDKNYD